MAGNTHIRIRHRPSGQLLAEGRRGWDITPFEGSYYIRKKCLRTDRFRANYIPGFCFYKFSYTWMDLDLPGHPSRNLGWMYWLGNPLLPFILFRVAVPAQHPEIEVENL